MDDFITGVFVTLDDNGEPVFPDDEDDKVPREKKATPSAFLFLGDNGNFSVLKKENVNANAGSHTKREWDSEGSEEGDHGSKMAAFKEKLLLEGVGSGYAADLPGGYGIFHSKASGKRVLCYDWFKLWKSLAYLDNWQNGTLSFSFSHWVFASRYQSYK